MAEEVKAQGIEADGDPLAKLGLDPVKAVEVLANYKRDLAALKEESKAWKAEQAEYAKLKADREAAEQAQLSEIEKVKRAHESEAKRAKELEGQLSAATRRASWNAALPDYLANIPEHIRPAAKRHFEALYLTEKWDNDEELTGVLDRGFEELRSAYGGEKPSPADKPAVGGVAAITAIKQAQGPTSSIGKEGLSGQQFLARMMDEQRRKTRK